MDRASPNVTAETLLEIVLRRSVSEPVFLLFWAPWDSKSTKLVDGLDDDAAVGLCNVDRAPKLGQLAGRNLPRALLFSGGCPVDVVSGATAEDLQDMLDDLEDFDGFEADPATPTLKPVVKFVRRMWAAELHANPDDAVVRQALINIAYSLRRPAEAAKLAEVAEPLAEREGPPPRRLTDERNEALEQAVLADPRDEGTWALYADWLQSQGDLRGEIIALSLEDPAQAKKLADDYPEVLLGEFAETYAEWGKFHGEIGMNQGATAITLDWSRGFIVGATVQTWRPAHRRVAEILSSLFTAAPLLQRLKLNTLRISPETQSLLGHSVPLGLRTLQIGPEEASGYATVDPPAIDLAPFLAQCPHLETIEAPEAIVTGFRLTPSLVAFSLPGESVVLGAAGANMRLARARLDRPSTEDAVRLIGVLDAIPTVTSLTLSHLQNTGAVLRVLLDTTLPERLEALSLPHGTLSEGGAVRALCKANARFPELTWLDVTYNDLDGVAGGALEKAFGPALNFNPQFDDEWYESIDE